MNRLRLRTVFALAVIASLCIVPLHPADVTAGSPETPAEQSAPKPPQAPDSEKEQVNMMGNMMGTMMEANMKAFISLLGKPEVAEKLAAFTKNYYDALVAKGFTKEEALRIVTATGLVNLPGQK